MTVSQLLAIVKLHLHNITKPLLIYIFLCMLKKLTRNHPGSGNGVPAWLCGGGVAPGPQALVQWGRAVAPQWEAKANPTHPLVPTNPPMACPGQWLGGLTAGQWVPPLQHPVQG